MKRLTEPASFLIVTLDLEEKTLDLSRRNLGSGLRIYHLEKFLRRRENVKKLENILSLNLSHNRLEKLPVIFHN